MKTVSAVAAVGLALCAASAAACPEGAKCVDAPAIATEAPYEVGQTLPRGKFMVLLNSEYFGLPPVPEGHWYFRVGDRAMVVRPDTLQVVADVTDQTNARF